MASNYVRTLDTLSSLCACIFIFGVTTTRPFFVLSLWYYSPVRAGSEESISATFFMNSSFFLYCVRLTSTGNPVPGNQEFFFFLGRKILLRH